MPGRVQPRVYPVIATKVLVIIIGCLYYKKLTAPYKIIFFHLVFAFFTEALGICLTLIEQPNNVWLFNIYLIVELWMIGWAGQMFLQRQDIKKYIKWILCAFTIYWIINWVKHTEGYLLNTFSVLSSFFLVALYVLVFFSNLSFTRQNMFSNPLFYICVSCLLYFACFIPLLGLFNYLAQTNKKMASNLYAINLALNYIRYGLVGVAFYLCGTQAQKIKA